MRSWYTAVRHYYKSGSATYNVSSSFQTYTVPAGVTSLSVDCVASRGWTYNDSYKGGSGGRVRCNLNVTPGETLYIMVGGIPGNQNTVLYNASDIRTNNAGKLNSTSLNSRLVVAGGGGNACDSGWSYRYAGGAGGGTSGGNGGGASSQYGGMGGTQSSGGYYNGAFGVGGCYNVNSGQEGSGSSGQSAGGSGWYGGGGSSPMEYAGGGGGSSYTNTSRCSSVSHTQGYMYGEGYVTLSYNYESTAEDYDYYVDEITYQIKNINGVHKAVKAWVKGQYYGN